MPDTIFTTLNEFATAFDIDENKFLFVSADVKLIAGYSAEDFYKDIDLPETLIHPDDRVEAGLITARLKEGECREISYRMITATGEIKRVHEKRDLIINQQTGHRVLFSSIKELSSLSAAHDRADFLLGSEANPTIENEIKSTTEKLDTFIETINDAFFVIDRGWKISKVNAAFESAFKQSRTDILGCFIWDLFPGIKSARFKHAFKKAAQKNEMSKFAAYFDPLNKWFDTTVYPSSEGITVFAKDISGERRVMEELIWTKNSLEGLINNTDDQIWSVDKEMRYVYMNKAYRNKISDFTGIEPKEGDPYIHNKPNARVNKKWIRFYARAFAGEVFTIIEESINPVAKSLSSFEISFHPIINPGSEITGVGCLARNITQRLKTEKAIIDQNGRLRLIASLTSHELRRPVASLLGLLNVIDRANIYNPDNMEIMDHLLTVGHEIDEVIRLIIHETFTEDLLNDDYK